MALLPFCKGKVHGPWCQPGDCVLRGSPGMSESWLMSLCNALFVQNTCCRLLCAGGEDSPLAQPVWSL